jgi:hypothetical protein
LPAKLARRQLSMDRSCGFQRDPSRSGVCEA